MADDKRGAQDLIDWLGLRRYPNWIRARWLGGGVGFLLVVAIPILFLLAILAAGRLLGDALMSDAGNPSLGTGALIAALLGAPFVIWGTWLRHKTQRLEQEGHMTDRITKAVEQLGAEKTVEKIGRQVTLRDGHPELHEPDEITFRTVVELQGEALDQRPNEEITNVKDWERFSVSLPNLEVRIGAILSLERIAQDSTILDNGRDHVRVMEILCAYIRENSNARQPVDFPLLDWELLPDDATDQDRAAHIREQVRRFGPSNNVAQEWAQTLPTPRADVQLAVQVVGRRNGHQRKIEAAWPDPPDADTVWPFDTTCPNLPDERGEMGLSYTELMDYQQKLGAWKAAINAYRGYLPDLRSANLQRVDMAGKRPDGADANFSGTLLSDARLEGANLSRACLMGADLTCAHLAGANLWGARMEGAYLEQARMEGAYLAEARMEGAVLFGACILGAVLTGARMEGADLMLAQLEGTQLASVRMDGVDLSNSWEAGASLRALELVNVKISSEQLVSTYGDASVELAPTLSRPSHWPDWKLPDDGENGFRSEWRKWQADPEGYRPPEKPDNPSET